MSGPSHLYVVLHGFVGRVGNVAELATQLRARVADEGLVLVPRSFQGLKSLDGVDVIGQRILAQIVEVVAGHPSLKCISFIGYSMGGLIARYLAGALYVQRPAFLGLAPINLVTVATPHLGAKLERRWALRRVLSYAGGRSGAQMLCADQQQLLALMSCRRSVFYVALRAFRRRSVLANTFNDKTV